MKKFGKIIAACLTSAMLVSALSLSAFAKTEVPLNNGAVLVLYDEGDEIPVQPRIARTNFSIDIPFYPDFGYVKLSTNKTSIPLDIGHSSLNFEFTKRPGQSYMGIYDVTAGEYITTGPASAGHMDGPYNFGKTFAIKNLTGNHTYRVCFGGYSSKGSASGILYSK